MTEKKIPLRRCVVCREMKPKRELIRVVRSKDGEFSIDPTGKKSGRGAYICLAGECVNNAQKSKNLERAFKSAVPKEIYEQLQDMTEDEQ